VDPAATAEPATATDASSIAILFSLFISVLRRKLQQGCEKISRLHDDSYPVTFIVPHRLLQKSSPL
jgi:TRAP-type C4-dicarboxylate transport system permease large subunit